jgi:polyhydroxybutyrate depolymerase
MLMKKYGCISAIVVSVLVLAAFAIIAVLSLRSIAPADACKQANEFSFEPGTSTHTIVTNGLERCYLLYIPSRYDPSQPVPVVISYHGFASNPSGQVDISRLNEIAETGNFLVVYPQGTGFPLRWNSFITIEWSPVDDVAFTRALVKDLESSFLIDKSRIYATGFSNGGALVHNLACEMSDTFAAVGIVSAPITEPQLGCIPSRPMPLIVFHGTEDLIVRYDGTSMNLPFFHSGRKSDQGGFSYVSANSWTKRWAKRNHCYLIPEELPAQGNVTELRYTGCLQDAEVIFYTITGGGHSWPGGGPLPGWLVGEVNNDITASTEMWSFFEKHTLMPPQ